MNIKTLQLATGVPVSAPPLRPAGPSPAAALLAPAEVAHVPVALEPEQALRGWLKDYSAGAGRLYERIAADPSAEGTMFRRGLMAAEVVTLAV